MQKSFSVLPFTAKYNGAPLDGIIKKLKGIWSKNLVESGLVKVTENDIYPGWNPAKFVLNQTASRGWAACGTSTYFDVDFGRYRIELAGYSLMADANDDDAPRNWNIICLQNNVVLSRKENNKVLCPNAKLGVMCGSYDTAYFPVDTIKKCGKFRFSRTGVSACNQDCLNIASIELFGTFYFPEISCAVCKKTQVFSLALYSLFNCYL